MGRECHSAPIEAGPSTGLGAIQWRVPGLALEAVVGQVSL